MQGQGFEVGLKGIQVTSMIHGSYSFRSGHPLLLPSYVTQKSLPRLPILVLSRGSPFLLKNISAWVPSSHLLIQLVLEVAFWAVLKSSPGVTLTCWSTENHWLGCPQATSLYGLNAFRAHLKCSLSPLLKPGIIFVFCRKKRHMITTAQSHRQRSHCPGPYNLWAPNHHVGFSVTWDLSVCAGQR